MTLEMKEKRTETTLTVERLVCDECIGLAVGIIANRLMLKIHKEENRNVWHLTRIIFEAWIPEKVEKGERRIATPSADGRMKGYMDNLGLGEIV